MKGSDLGEELGDHLADVAPPLRDVGVETVQVPAEAQRDDLEVVWKESESPRPSGPTPSETQPKTHSRRSERTDAPRRQSPRRKHVA